MIEEFLAFEKVLKTSGIERRLKEIEGREIWNVRGIRTINGEKGDDRGDIDLDIRYSSILHNHDTRYDDGQITFVLPGIAASKAWVRLPVAGTITGVYITGDISGSAVVDLWKDTFANFPPTVADTITAAAKPTLTNQQSNSNLTLSGWVKTITQGDWIMANVDSASTLNTIVVVITYNKTF